VSPKSFSVPITIIQGIGVPTTVRTVAEAYDILENWPQHRRNGAHTLAKNACRAALCGDIEIDLAEDAFRGFARRNLMLVDGAVLGALSNGPSLQRHHVT
jgi:hypothetical protein